MKNLLIYINPEGFDSEAKRLVKIQIENSIELGWKENDILLVTNFAFNHKNIRSIVIGDDTFCPFYKEASKVFAILRLFEGGLIGKDIYWFHDLDAFQLDTITEDELGLTKYDAGFCDHGRKPEWNTGSFFFKNTSKYIFEEMGKRVKPGLDKNGRRQHEQQALIDMTNENIFNINSRIKRMDITYNFGTRKIAECFKKAVKPIKVLHFHPNHSRNKGRDTLKIMMYGQNDLKKSLMNPKLTKIFNNHGYS